MFLQTYYITVAQLLTTEGSFVTQRIDRNKCQLWKIIYIL